MTSATTFCQYRLVRAPLSFVTSLTCVCLPMLMCVCHPTLTSYSLADGQTVAADAHGGYKRACANMGGVWHVPEPNIADSTTTLVCCPAACGEFLTNQRDCHKISAQIDLQVNNPHGYQTFTPVQNGMDTWARDGHMGAGRRENANNTVSKNRRIDA